MNSSILTAIESLCDDIATNTNPEENKKRAEAVVSLAFVGIFTPAEYDDEYEDYTEDDSVAGAEKIKSKSQNPASNSSITALSLPLSERSRAACLPLFRNCSRRKCRSIKAIKTTGAPPRSVNTLTENTSNNSTAATSSRLYRT